MASLPIRNVPAPPLDMDLAFKTREKLACTNTGEGSNLRRVVLLCNTYDTFQKRLTNHFCVSRSRTPPAAREEKLRISCCEVAVLDDDDDDDEDKEREDVEDTPDSTIMLQSPPALADDEEPPPYELHPPPRHPGRAVPPVPVNVAVTEAEEEDREEPIASTTDLSIKNGDSTPPTYTAVVQVAPPAPETSKPGTQHIENVPEPQSPAPPTPRKAKLARPGLSSRMSYGHRTVDAPHQSGQGTLQFH